MVDLRCAESIDVAELLGEQQDSAAIAEMVTGEGKTLVAALPAALNALTGKGVYIVTVNDYLAKRDRDWMVPIHEYLGLSVGAIQSDMSPRDRHAEYACDITYGTNNEFGFDYLRDNMKLQRAILKAQAIPRSERLGWVALTGLRTIVITGTT